MKKLVIFIVALFIVVLHSNKSLCNTITWGLFPDLQMVSAGSTYNLDLKVFGLGDLTSPSVSGFDIDITVFGDTTFNSATFSSFLGIPDTDFSLLTNSTETSILVDPTIFPPGVFIREDSNLLPAQLDALQPSSFTLATLTYTANTVGTVFASGDTFSGGLFLTDGITIKEPFTSATVNVVPEPSTLLLIGSGLIGFVILGRKRFRR
jgi:hypothetical protein